MHFVRFAPLLAFIGIVGCSQTFRPYPQPNPRPENPGLLPLNDTPANAVERFVLSYEQKKAVEYQDMFTGDFTYEFSNISDPTLVSLYSTGWFKPDEKESSSHLFAGYTPPGEATREPASSISITLAVTTPTDDNASGVNPKTHKVLATRVDGRITVPQQNGPPRTYVIFDNNEVFYLVRGDTAVNLDSTQPADATHWYIYRWEDLTAKAAMAADSSAQSDTITWGALKNMYR